MSGKGVPGMEVSSLQHDIQWPEVDGELPGWGVVLLTGIKIFIACTLQKVAQVSSSIGKDGQYVHVAAKRINSLQRIADNGHGTEGPQLGSA